MGDIKRYQINWSAEEWLEVQKRALEKKLDVASFIRSSVFTGPGKELQNVQEIYEGGIHQMQFLNNNLQILNRDLKLIFNEFQGKFDRTYQETRKSFEAYHSKTEETFSAIRKEIGQISGYGDDLARATSSLKKFEFKFWTAIIAAVILSGFVTFFSIKVFGPERDIIKQQQVLNSKLDIFTNWLESLRTKKK